MDGSSQVCFPVFVVGLFRGGDGWCSVLCILIIPRIVMLALHCCRVILAKQPYIDGPCVGRME